MQQIKMELIDNCLQFTSTQNNLEEIPRLLVIDFKVILVLNNFVTTASLKLEKADRLSLKSPQSNHYLILLPLWNVIYRSKEFLPF